MCTVSYVPLGAGDFILTSNRDENPERITLGPDKAITINASGKVVAPRDSKAGGTWIAMATNGRVACLLNGAFIKHKHTPPYSRSRGLVVLEYFEAPTARTFAESVDLTGVENFTLVLCENNTLFELRWDGQTKFFKELDAGQPHIWSSCTLYTTEVAAAKEKKFMDWKQTGAGTKVEEIAHFHGYQNPDGFLLDLPMVRTVSITSILLAGKNLKMYYRDLLTDHYKEEAFDLEGV